MSPSFGFVVLHYLAAPVTEQCVSFLLALGGDHPVVIADNASPDGSVSFLRQRFGNERRVSIISNDHNEGYAGGINAGCRFLTGHFDPDLVVALNNDVFIKDPLFLEKAAACYVEAPFGVLGPDVFCPASGAHQSPPHVLPPDLRKLAEIERDCAERARLMPAGYALKRASSYAARLKGSVRSGLRAVKHSLTARGQVNASESLAAAGRLPAESRVSGLHERPASNVVLHGACLIFSKPFLAARGYALDPGTFLYMEEDILAYECLRDGWTTRYEPSLRVEHLEDASTKASVRSRYGRERLKAVEKGRSASFLRSMMEKDLDTVRERGALLCGTPSPAGVRISLVGTGFASNPVNSVIFRKNAVCSAVSPGHAVSYCCFYDKDGGIRLGRKTRDAEWEDLETGLSGDPRDAHNALSLAADGEGALHLAVPSHNGALALFRSDPSGGAFLEETLPDCPARATYPEFHQQPGGSLLLLCRSGRSGDGALKVFRYTLPDRKWSLVHDRLLSGDGTASPYWQACTDPAGRLHITWSWRRTPDASTNRDLFYMVSDGEDLSRFTDGQGNETAVPQTPSVSCPVLRIPEGSGLVNQTSMTLDPDGMPCTALLMRTEGVFQYVLAYPRDGSWTLLDTKIRGTDFIPRGRGSLRLPCSRPLLLPAGKARFLLVARDAEQGGRIACHLLRTDPRGDLPVLMHTRFLTGCGAGAGEICCDTAAWEKQGRLDLFLQYCIHMPDNRCALDAESPAAVLSVGKEALL